MKFEEAEDMKVVVIGLLLVALMVVWLVLLVLFFPILLVPLLWDQAWATRMYRALGTTFRRVAKPALLWINAWQFKQSEEEIEYLQSLRPYVSAKEHRQRVRQMKLQRQRNQIAGW